MSGGTKNSQSVSSVTGASINFTAPGTAGTVTVDVGNGASAVLTITNAPATAFNAISPSSLSATAGVATSSYTLSVNGTLTATESVTLSDGGAGGTFSPSSLSFATSDTSHTFTYTPASGASPGSITLTASGTGAFTDSKTTTCVVSTGPVVVPATDANMRFSPYNFDPNIVSGHRRCISPGGYLKTGFTGTSCTLNLAAPSGTPQIRWSIDGGVWSVGTITGNALAVASGLTSGNHTLDVECMAANGGVGWQSSPAPNQYLEVVSMTLDAGASVVARTDIRPNNIVFYGDSIYQGVAATGNTNGSNGVGYDDAMNTFARGVAEALSAEYGLLGYTGQGYTFAAAGGAGPCRFYDPGNPSDSSWWQYQGGSSRLVAGLFSPLPYAVLIGLGRNEYNTLDAMLRALVSAALTDIRAASPGAWLVQVIPFDGTKRTAITNGFNDYKSEASDDKAILIDIGTDAYFNDSLKTGAGVPSNGAVDGTHPDYRTHGVIAARMVKAFQVAVGGFNGCSRARVANAF